MPQNSNVILFNNDFEEGEMPKEASLTTLVDDSIKGFLPAYREAIKLRREVEAVPEHLYEAIGVIYSVSVLECIKAQLN